MKTIKINCCSCGKETIKLLKEYKRQIKKGRTKFYCDLSCAALDNQGLLATQEYFRKNPEEAYKRLINSKGYKQRHRFRRKHYLEFYPFTYYLCRIRTRNKAKGLSTNLIAQDLKEQWEKQKGICPYTGIKMRLYEEKTYPDSASVDRIDSSKEYTRDNIEFVCLSINYGKNEFTKEQMLDFIKQIKK